MTRCARCNADNPEGVYTCQACGYALPAVTPPTSTAAPTVPIPPPGTYPGTGAPVPPSPPDGGSRGKGLLITVIVLGVLLLIAVTALVTVALTSKKDTVATTDGATTIPPPTSPPATTAAPKRSSTTTSAPAGKATLAPLPTVVAGQDALLAFAYTGDPAGVALTNAVVDGKPSAEPKDGYVNPLPLRAQGPGTVAVAVRLVLRNGDEVTTDNQTLTIVLPPAPPTTPVAPTPTPSPGYVPPKPDKGAVGIVNEDNVSVRAGPSTASDIVGTVNRGTQVDVSCLEPGETVPGEKFVWAQLTDGNYIFMKYLTVNADVENC